MRHEWSTYRSNCLSWYSISAGLVISFMKKCCWVRFFNPVEMLIHVAVSTLSPVNIHTYIPACLKLSIV